jgi:hypothetical protein
MWSRGATGRAIRNDNCHKPAVILDTTHMGHGHGQIPTTTWEASRHRNQMLQQRRTLRLIVQARPRRRYGRGLPAAGPVPARSLGDEHARVLEKDAASGAAFRCQTCGVSCV